MKTHDQLTRATQHVAEAKERIEKQRRLILQLAESGRDTREARSLLDVMLSLLEGMEAHRRQIEAELSSHSTLEPN